MPPIEPIIDLLLQVILPATVAAGLVLFALRTLCNQQYADLQVAIALIAGLLVGNYYPGSFDYLPVSFGWPWLLAVAVLLLIYSATMNQVSNRLAGSRRIALRLGVLLLAIGLACYATMPEELRTPSWIVGYCVLALADTAVLENQSLRRAGSHVPYAWGFILLTGTALVMICAGTARIADLAFFGLAALTGVWFASVRSPANLAVASLSLGITLPEMMLSGMNDTFSEVPHASFILLAISPLMLAVNSLPGLDRLPPPVCRGLKLLVPLLPILIATGLALNAEGLSPDY